MITTASIDIPTILCMRKRRESPVALGPSYVREWRKFRRMTQEQLGFAIGRDKSAVSRIERRESPYNQETLERMAERLGCSPAELLGRDPNDLYGSWGIVGKLSRLTDADRKAVLAVINAYLGNDDENEAQTRP